MPTLCNFLHKNGSSQKKLSKVALQRSEEAREHTFRSTVSIYKPPMLVFLDETGTDRRDAMRRFGYSLRGKPARTHKLLVRGKHLTAIAVICVERILCCKVVEGSVTGDVFEDFLYTSLLPKLFPFNGENAKSVVIMDSSC